MFYVEFTIINYTTVLLVVLVNVQYIMDPYDYYFFPCTGQIPVCPSPVISSLWRQMDDDSTVVGGKDRFTIFYRFTPQGDLICSIT